MPATNIIAIAVALVVVIGPLTLALAGVLRARRASTGAAPGLHWNWRLAIQSTLLYVLAFNLTFFIQELFLVLPKAFTPGLRPTLFHNNHRWDGEHALASLFQGTGALATLLSGVACALLLRRVRSPAGRLLLIWMAYCGLFMALPQVVIGALSGGSDVGMAMDYLGLGAMAKTTAALIALAAIPLVASWLTRPLLALADDPAVLATARARTSFIVQVATLPVLVATVLIIPFRVPREWIEVIFPPVLVAVTGMAWIQAGAWRFDRIRPSTDKDFGSPAYALAAVVALLLVFQFALRPGIAFYR